MTISKVVLILLFSFSLQINLFAQSEKYVDSLLQLYVQNKPQAIVVEDYNKLSIKESKFFKKYSCWKSRDIKPRFEFFVNIGVIKYLMYYGHSGYCLVIFTTSKKECIELQTFFGKGADVDSFFGKRIFWDSFKCCFNR